MACASSQAGNHHDLFDIAICFGELCTLVAAAQISLKGIFLNADSGFDTKELGQDCFRRGIEANIAVSANSGQKADAEDTYMDSELYRERTAIEQTNAKLDSFKALLMRFKTTVENWLVFHFLAFVVLLLCKISSDPKR